MPTENPYLVKGPWHIFHMLWISKRIMSNLLRWLPFACLHSVFIFLFIYFFLLTGFSFVYSNGLSENIPEPNGRLLFQFEVFVTPDRITWYPGTRRRRQSSTCDIRSHSSWWKWCRRQEEAESVFIQSANRPHWNIITLNRRRSKSRICARILIYRQCVPRAKKWRYVKSDWMTTCGQ